MANIKAPSVLTNFASKNKDLKDGDNSPVAVPSTIDTLLFLSHSQDREGFPIQFAIDDFNFIEEIAQSKNSTVWLVNYRFANNLLVLKEINLQRFMKRHWVNLQREFVSIQLKHEGVLPTHGFFFLPNRVFFVLEHAPGGDLYQSLKREGPYSEERTKHIMHQLLEAVKYIHAQNIIHRDLKLDNILYVNTSSDKIKVADFGVCFPKTEFRSHPETKVGTLDYMAPEVIEDETEGSQIYDEKVDIWAMGIICYELLHGVPPFSNPNMEQTCFNISRATYQTSAKLSPECVDFINNVLKKAPHNRPTIEEMKKHPWLQSSVPKETPSRVLGTGPNKGRVDLARDKILSNSMRAEFHKHHIRCEILRRQTKIVYVMTDCPITRQLLSALLSLKQYRVVVQPTSSVKTIASRQELIQSEVYIVDVSAYNIQFIRTALRVLLSVPSRPILIALVTITQQRQPDVLADLFDYYILKPVERTQIDVFPTVVNNETFEAEAMESEQSGNFTHSRLLQSTEPPAPFGPLLHLTKAIPDPSDSTSSESLKPATSIPPGTNRTEPTGAMRSNTPKPNPQLDSASHRRSIWGKIKSAVS